MSPEGVVFAEEVWKRFRSDQPSRDFKDLFRRLRTRRRRQSRGWRWVLSDVSLTVEPGTSMALIGGNGSGKSTMLKILAGVMDPYAGRVDVTGRIGALIEVRAGIHQELSGRENIFLAGSLLGLSRRSVTDRFDEIVHFADLEDAIDRQTKFYSTGMQMRLGFGVAAFLEPAVLLVDEVLAVGDASFQQRCLDRIRKVLSQGTTLVFVSHDLAAVETMCQDAVWLNNGLVAARGTTHEVLARVPAVGRRGGRGDEHLDGRVVADQGGRAVGGRRTVPPVAGAARGRGDRRELRNLRRRARDRRERGHRVADGGGQAQRAASTPGRPPFDAPSPTCRSPGGASTCGRACSTGRGISCPGSPRRRSTSSEATSTGPRPGSCAWRRCTSRRRGNPTGPHEQGVARARPRLIMRALVVARWAPWPARSGAQLRSAHMIAALASVGDVDVFLHVDPRHGTDLHVPPGLAVRRIGGATRAGRPPTRVDRAVTLLPGTRPEAIRHLDVGSARREFTSLGTSRYDVAWFVRLESWLALGDLVDAPAVVDYDDLRDRPVGPRLTASWPAERRSDSWAHTAIRTRYRRADAAAWGRLQGRVASEVAAVVVCSELDRDHLAVGNARSCPTGSTPRTGRSGRTPVRSPTDDPASTAPLAYEPNVDAATVLVRDVLPRLRTLVPEVVVRLVGRGDERVARLAAVDGVTVTGPVDDMVTELRRADLVAVPLREGGGTRIKVLEALAHGIPVVATSVAVEGLAVDPGRHLLVADAPDAFAASCATLLSDEARRRDLADAGAQLVRDRYRWVGARAAAVRVVTDVIDAGTESLAAAPPTAPT